MRNLTSEPQARRSIGGYLVPLAFMLAGGAALGGVMFLAPSNGGRFVESQWYVLVFAAISMLAGVGIERDVQNQLDLARAGRTADAKIDQVHKRCMRNDNSWAKFHFISEDGQLIDGKSTIREMDTLALTEGSAAFVFYDPRNPRNNRLAESMWAVTWGEED